MNSQIFHLDVWGDFACFTRPELKVERVSYDMITPSAARAIFESIYHKIVDKKAVMRWQIEDIRLLKPIQWISVRRNEINFSDSSREQRNSLILKDVRYLLTARLEPDIAIIRTLPTAQDIHWPKKLTESFERRASKGQYFSPPYFGCREFAAFYRLVPESALAAEEYRPIEVEKDLGLMFYDWDFANPHNPQATFFHARLEQGCMNLKGVEILR
jgi:CRISPR-associated protein Cas5d